MKVSEAKQMIEALQKAVEKAEAAGRDELLADDIFAVDDEARKNLVDALTQQRS